MRERGPAITERTSLIVSDFFFTAHPERTFKRTQRFIDHVATYRHAGNFFTATDLWVDWSDNFLCFTVALFENGLCLDLKTLCKEYMSRFVDRLEALTPYTWKWMAFVHKATAPHMHIFARALTRSGLQTTPDAHSLSAALQLSMELARRYSL